MTPRIHVPRRDEREWPMNVPGGRMEEGVWIFPVVSLTIEEMKHLNALEEAGSRWTIRDADGGYEIRLRRGS